jgi:hypothetical protein
MESLLEIQRQRAAGPLAVSMIKHFLRQGALEAGQTDNAVAHLGYAADRFPPGFSSKPSISFFSFWMMS